MKRLLQLLPVTLLVVLAGLLTVGTGGTKDADKKASKDEFKNYTEVIRGRGDLAELSAEFEMVAVPGGTFMMGSPEGEKGRDIDEGPRHPVTVKPFWMSKVEIPWEVYDFYWLTEPEADPGTPKAELKPGTDAVSRPTPPYVDETYGHERDGHPALCMTHHNAMKFCEWMSVMTGKDYRLPTEAEWEYACRAGSDGPYCFGDDVSKLGEYAWYKANSTDETHPKGTTHPVGTKKPNKFGLHDMHGNVMEWVMDHYKKDYYSQFDLKVPAVRPVLIPTKMKWSHVAKGGHWRDGPADLRSAGRRNSDPEWMKHDPQLPQSIWWLTKYDVIGLRLVRAVEEQENLAGLTSKVTKYDSE